MSRLSAYVIKYIEDFEIEVWEYYKHRARHNNRHPRTLSMSLVFSNFKIKGVFMDVTVQKNQFTPSDPTNPQSPLIINGHIAPTGKENEAEDVDDATIAYTSSNPAVATIAPDATNPRKYVVTFVGDGTTSLGSSAKTKDDVNVLTDSINLTVVEPEATNLNMALDLPTA